MSDAVVLAIRASAPDLVELPMSPPLNATARFGMVTIASRIEPPLLDKVRDLMREISRDSSPTRQKAKRWRKTNESL